MIFRALSRHCKQESLTGGSRMGSKQSVSHEIVCVCAWGREREREKTRVCIFWQEDPELSSDPCRGGRPPEESSPLHAIGSHSQVGPGREASRSPCSLFLSLTSLQHFSSLFEWCLIHQWLKMTLWCHYSPQSGIRHKEERAGLDSIQMV